MTYIPNFITHTELMNMDLPETEWIIENLVPKVGLTAISGAPGSHKTWIGMHLASCIATGEKFLNRFPAQQRKVVYIDEENGEHLLRSRMQLLNIEENENLQFDSYSNFHIQDKNTDKLLQACLDSDTEVVIIDSLIRIHNYEENSASEMKNVFNHFKRFKKNEIAVIYLHHDKKTQFGEGFRKERMRGSSEIFASLDSQISIHSKKDSLSIYPNKLRYALEHKPFSVDIIRNKETIAFEFSGEIDEAKNSKIQQAEIQVRQVLREFNIPLNKKAIVETIKNKTADIGEKSIYTAIKGMETTGVIKTEKGDNNAAMCTLIKK